MRGPRLLKEQEPLPVPMDGVAGERPATGGYLENGRTSTLRIQPYDAGRADRSHSCHGTRSAAGGPLHHRDLRRLRRPHEASPGAGPLQPHVQRSSAREARRRGHGFERALDRRFPLARCRATSRNSRRARSSTRACGRNSARAFITRPVGSTMRRRSSGSAASSCSSTANTRRAATCSSISPLLRRRSASSPAISTRPASRRCPAGSASSSRSRSAPICRARGISTRRS